MLLPKHPHYVVFAVGNSLLKCFFSPFSSLMMKKLSYKYYNKRITTRDNGKVQSHDKKESKLNSTRGTVQLPAVCR